MKSFYYIRDTWLCAGWKILMKLEIFIIKSICRVQQNESFGLVLSFMHFYNFSIVIFKLYELNKLFIEDSEL